jgi:hypothetical protein
MLMKESQPLALPRCSLGMGIWNQCGIGRQDHVISKREEQEPAAEPTETSADRHDE